MKIVICGSIKFIKEMRDVKGLLEKLGHIVIMPRSAELNQTKAFWNELRNNNIKEFIRSKEARMREYFNEVRSSDAIIVLNYDKEGKKNYIGPNTLLEMGLAFDCRKKIFVLNPLPGYDNAYEELISMSPIVLDGDISRIN